MIKPRLIRLVPESRALIGKAVGAQLIALFCNILTVLTLAYIIENTYTRERELSYPLAASILAGAMLLRFCCSKAAASASYLLSKAAKERLRGNMFQKIFQFGAAYREKIYSAELVQLATEGVEQLEAYFAAYLPQFFYAMLAPLFLFLTLSFISVQAAFILFICVPLIPLSIMAVQRLAKKLLAKYWGRYSNLGSRFLENLQAMTTLKVYKADAYKHRQMNEEAEEFRKITMRVLIMQLNSITLMDLFAYGGAALGIILALTEYGRGRIGIFGTVSIILLSADFFIPMRQLGSLFHVAMTGMAASDKMFALLDMPIPDKAGKKAFPKSAEIRFAQVSFAYAGEGRSFALDNISFSLPERGLFALVGESGSGKSTLAALLCRKKEGYGGEIFIGDSELGEIKEEELAKHLCYVSYNSHLFKGTVAYNLQMGKADASSEEMEEVLKKCRLWDFFAAGQGLDTELLENAANLSGGQRQRLALARALLHDSRIYIFDEASSNIDVESEELILAQISELAQTKSVLLISHRLANVREAKKILVLQNGMLLERGEHGELLALRGIYARMWEKQKELENDFGKGDQEDEARS